MKKEIITVICGLTIISFTVNACSLPFTEASPLPYNEIVKSYEESDDLRKNGGEDQETKIDLYSIDELIMKADCIVTGTVSDILASKEN